MNPRQQKPEAPGQHARSERKRQSKGKGQTKRPWIVIAAAGAIVLVVVVLFALKAGNSSGSDASAPITPALLNSLTGVSATTENAVGIGSAPNRLIAVRTQALTGANGRPEVLYYGAEYCPYCASERWAMIVALSRFGRFTGLKTTHSAADDVFPNTPTFTFYGSTYQSQYLDFTPIEMQTNFRVNGRYAPLQTPTTSQEQLFQRYNSPPYIPANQATGIPFINFANQYVLSGTQVNPTLLQGHSWEQVAAQLNNPASDESKAIVGGANELTAALCEATSNKPSEVCDQPAIKQIASTLERQTVPAGN